MVSKNVVETVDTVYCRKSEQTEESAMKSLFEELGGISACQKTILSVKKKEGKTRKCSKKARAAKTDWPTKVMKERPALSVRRAASCSTRPQTGMESAPTATRRRTASKPCLRHSLPSFHHLPAGPRQLVQRGAGGHLAQGSHGPDAGHSESSQTFLFSEEVREVDPFALQNMDAFRDYVRSSGPGGCRRP